MIEEIEDVTTTRLAPFSFAAVSTFIVPLIAGSKSSFFQGGKRERNGQKFHVIKQLKNQSKPERQVIATTLVPEDHGLDQRCTERPGERRQHSH